jgi:3-oxoacyl-[acyl-carrier-protein] synthase II
MDDVVITGMSLRTALGDDVDQVWSRMLAGHTEVQPIPQHWSTQFRCRVWSPPPHLEAATLGLNRQEAGMLDPVAMMATDCGARALRHAGFALEPRGDRANTIDVRGLDPQRAGVFLGSAIGGARSFLDHHVIHLRDVARARGLDGDEVLQSLSQTPRYSPFAVPLTMINAAGAYLGIKLGLTGPNLSFGMACASGTVAIGNAFRSLRRGELDVVLCGGSEYLDDGLGGMFRGFDVARALTRFDGPAEECNRPFDRRRAGFLFSGGGACVLIAERAEHAAARGATPLARIQGYGESFDAHSVMAIKPDGLQVRRAIEDALRDAGITAADVSYVNAHGTGTPANDEAEARVLMQVFGDGPVVNSSKSLFGHTIGASGAIEALACVQSLRHAEAHPSRGLMDPIAPLNFAIRRMPLRAGFAVSESFAFGGHNAVLVLGGADAADN